MENSCDGFGVGVVCAVRSWGLLLSELLSHLVRWQGEGKARVCRAAHCSVPANSLSPKGQPAPSGWKELLENKIKLCAALTSLLYPPFLA